MQLETPEQKADALIKGIMSSGVAGAIIPRASHSWRLNVGGLFKTAA